MSPSRRVCGPTGGGRGSGGGAAGQSGLQSTNVIDSALGGADGPAESSGDAEAGPTGVQAEADGRELVRVARRHASLSVGGVRQHGAPVVGSR